MGRGQLDRIHQDWPALSFLCPQVNHQELMGLHVLSIETWTYQICLFTLGQVSGFNLLYDVRSKLQELKFLQCSCILWLQEWENWEVARSRKSFHKTGNYFKSQHFGLQMAQLLIVVSVFKTSHILVCSLMINNANEYRIECGLSLLLPFGLRGLWLIFQEKHAIK